MCRIEVFFLYVIARRIPCKPESSYGLLYLVKRVVIDLVHVVFFGMPQVPLGKVPSLAVLLQVVSVNRPS